jgi:hypothetical protein
MRINDRENLKNPDVGAQKIHNRRQGFRSGYALIRIVFGIWIRIRINRVKIWIRIHIKVKIQELSRLKMVSWRAVNAQNGGVKAQTGSLKGR